MGITPATAKRPAATDATSSAPASTKPVAVFRFENVSAAVFIDRQPTKEGGSPLFNIVVSRRYRDKEGAWKSTHTLWPSDALAASLALLKCYEFTQDARPDEGQAA